MHKKRKIIVVVKLRPFDEAAWKRLIMAYAYYLHEQHEAEAEAVTATKHSEATSSGGSA